MDVTLHIGAHRCATTTFQYYLRNNADRLRELRVGFWGPRRTRKGLFSGIQPGGLPLPGRDPAQRGNGRVRLACARSAAAGIEHLVVSDENMLGTMRDNLRTSTLYGSAGERMARYAQAFQGRLTQVVLNIRSLDYFWASGMGYALSRGHGLPSEGLLHRVSVSPRSWRDVITDISCALGDVPLWVLPFEGYAGRPDDQLAAITGGEVPSGHARAWLNATPHLPELRMMVEPAMRHRLPRGTGRWIPFDVAQTAALREHYADDIMWLMAGADGLARMISDSTNTRADNRPGFEPTRGSIDDDERRRMA